MGRRNMRETRNSKTIYITEDKIAVVVSSESMREYIEAYMADENTKFADKMFDKALIGYDFNGQVYYDHHKMTVILKKTGLTDSEVNEKILLLIAKDKINIIVIPKKL